MAVFVTAASVSTYAGHDYEEPVDFTPSDHVKDLLDLGEKVVFIDLRESASYSQGHLPDAISIPVGELGHRWSEVPNTGRVILYCDCPPGLRDETYAFLLLWQQKYRNISFLDVGYSEWVKRGYPLAAKSP